MGYLFVLHRCLPSLYPMKEENIDGSILWEQLMGSGLCSYVLLPYSAPMNKKASEKINSGRL